ncbi:MAG: DEAD/DEAH box helicase family protein, partial [Lachnospiraceae bacterium]
MGNSKFFTNKNGNTLFDKFKELSHDMASFRYFQAVVGYFRSSGYFKLREELKNANKGEDVTKIQILIGINIDNIFRKHNKATLMFESAEEAKKIYTEDFINDVKDAKYSKDVEDGILQLSNDLASGRVEVRLHSSKNLHAKFYLCLPENHTPSNAGFVIMGSSNISDSGLGTHRAERYELNISTSEYDDVQFCKDQFAELWEQSTPIVLSDLPTQRTHLSTIQPTPYELYVKILIDTFGSQVEDDFTMDMPKGVRNLKYQKDAVSQGYQMLLNHNGFFLADVVGLGKTIVATMIAKRFVEANGRHTRILVVHPPALHYNWKETFKLFGIEHKAHFINNGSLNKVVEGLDRYKEPSEYDLIIVDEAHGFRTGTANSYDELQRICKSKRTNPGLIAGNKRIMLLSATPLNNRPEDLQNLILLFQDAARCTIEGVSNINNLFAPLTARYKRAMANRANNADTTEIDSIYLEIRERLLDKITVRRTRHNIWKDDNYRKDLEYQHITFPTILPPSDFTYQMDTSLCELFYNTLNVLTDTPTTINIDGKGLYYARYRAIEYLNEDEVPNNSAKQMALNLAGIYRVHMVKRL